MRRALTWRQYPHTAGLAQTTGTDDLAEGLARAADMTDAWLAVTAGEEDRAALMRLVREDGYAVFRWDDTFLLLSRKEGDRPHPGSHRGRGQRWRHHRRQLIHH